MRRISALALTTLAFAAAAGAAVEDPKKPEWRVTSNTVAIFGNVQQPGFYAISDKPTTLARLVASAGIRRGKGVVILLQRPNGNDAKVIQVDSARLEEDGNITVQANDVIQVTAPKEG